jgi:hypothetical protein
MSRPKKRMLLYCADAELGSAIALTLRVRLLATAVSTSTPQEFLWESMADGPAFDCVVMVRSELGRYGDASVLALLHGEGPLTVEVMNGLPLIEESCAEKRVYGPVNVAMVEIVQTVRLAMTRKRGPKGSGLDRAGYQLVSIGNAPAERVAA